MCGLRRPRSKSGSFLGACESVIGPMKLKLFEGVKMPICKLYLHFQLNWATGADLGAFSARFFEIGPISGLQLSKFLPAKNNDLKF